MCVREEGSEVSQRLCRRIEDLEKSRVEATDLNFDLMVSSAPIHFYARHMNRSHFTIAKLAAYALIFLPIEPCAQLRVRP